MTSKPFDRVRTQIKRGIDGYNTGVSTGLKGLDRYISNIGRGRYDIIFADEGVGKTAFIDHTYVLSPLLSYPKYNVIYYSLEVPYVNKLTKWMAWLIYKRQRIVTSINEILSKGTHEIPENVLEYVDSYEDVINNILSTRLTLYTEMKTPSEIHTEILTYMDAKGRLINDMYGNKVFLPDDPDEIFTVIIDNGSDLDLDSGMSERLNVNELSKHIKMWRNLYNINTSLVMHTNREVANILRGKLDQLFPKKSDISISSKPGKDADTIIALFSPYEYANSSNDLHKYMNYDIYRLPNMIKAYGILKNRDGMAPVKGGLVMIPEPGYFREIPSGELMEGKHYDQILNHQRLTP